MPSHCSPWRMPSTISGVERSRSVSSILRTSVPPSCRAKSQLNRAVRAPPTCKYPVGDGAKRTRGPAEEKLEEAGLSGIVGNSLDVTARIQERQAKELRD